MGRVRCICRTSRRYYRHSIFDIFDPDKSWWELILAGLATALIAAGVWGESDFGHRATEASIRLQAKSEERIAELTKEAAEPQKETTGLQLELQRQRKIATARAGPRELDTKRFEDALNGKPTGTVRILYKNETEEFWFAFQIGAELKKTGWKVTEMAPIPPPRTSGISISSDIKWRFMDMLLITPVLEIDSSAATALRHALPEGRAAPIGSGGMME